MIFFKNDTSKALICKHINEVVELTNLSEILESTDTGKIRLITQDANGTRPDGMDETGTVIIGLTDRNYGITADRPTLTKYAEPFEYFDKTIGKPIYWTGSGWVDAVGNSLI